MTRAPSAKSPNLAQILKALGVLLAMFWLAPPADARPIYKKIFGELYNKEFKEAKLDCSMCHPTKEKQVRTCYAEGLAKELGEKNVRDEQKIADAMRAIEKGSCKCGEWGKRIHEKKAPCKRCNSCMESAFEAPLRELLIPKAAVKESKTGS